MFLTQIVFILLAIGWLYIISSGWFGVIRFQGRFRTQIADAFPIKEMTVVNTNPWLFKIKDAIKAGKLQDPDLIREYHRTVRRLILSLIMIPMPFIAIILYIALLR